MHVLGKVFLGLAVIGGAAGVVLTSKLLDAQTAWSKKVVDLEQQAETNETQLEEKRRRLDQLLAEVEHEKLGWGAHWNGIDQTGEDVRVVSAQEGTITAPNLGRVRGLGTGSQSLPTVHLFALDGGSNSTYLGEYQATQIQENTSSFRMVQPPFTNDDPMEFQFKPQLVASGFPRGVKFRIRESYPAGTGLSTDPTIQTALNEPATVPDTFSTRFGDMALNLRTSRRDYRKQSRNLQMQQNLLKVAQTHRDQRIAEIVGTNYLPANLQLTPDQKQVLPELADGYMVSVEKANVRRNEALKELDDLRRLVKAAKDRVAALWESNKELASQLPQPPDAAASNPQVSSID